LDRLEALLWCEICFFATLIFCALEVGHIPLAIALSEVLVSHRHRRRVFGTGGFMSLMGVLFDYGPQESSHQHAGCIQ